MGHVITNNIFEEADENQVLVDKIEQNPYTGDWLIAGNIFRSNSRNVAALEITDTGHLKIFGQDPGVFTGHSDEDQDTLADQYYVENKR